MKANGKDIIELINIKGWAILELKGPQPDEGPGVSHIPCDGWMRFGMRKHDLYCRVCEEPIPNEIVTLWLLLSADKNSSNDYYNNKEGV
jgi:hypothetical protein